MVETKEQVPIQMWPLFYHFCEEARRKNKRNLVFHHEEIKILANCVSYIYTDRETQFSNFLLLPALRLNYVLTFLRAAASGRNWDAKLKTQFRHHTSLTHSLHTSFILSSRSLDAQEQNWIQTWRRSGRIKKMFKLRARTHRNVLNTHTDALLCVSPVHAHSVRKTQSLAVFSPLLYLST